MKEKYLWQYGRKSFAYSVSYQAVQQRQSMQTCQDLSIPTYISPHHKLEWQTQKMTTALFLNIHVDYYKYSHSTYSLCFYTINEPVLEINSIRDGDSMGGDTPFELLLLIQLFF